MRLIRLTSRDSTGIFDSTFNENLVLAPNSQIALQSVACGVETKKIIIDGENNQITYQIADNVVRTIVVEEGIYGSSDVDKMLRYIQTALNSSCDLRNTDSTNKMLGIEWRARKNDSKRVQIGYEIAQPKEWATAWTFTNAEHVTTNNGQFQSTAVTTSTNANNCFLPYVQSRGNGFTRCRTGTLIAGPDVNQTGYFIGWTKNLDVSGTTLNLADAPLAIHATIDGGNKIYRLFKDGNEVPAAQETMDTYTLNDPNNEFQEITLNGSQLEANIYRTNGDKVTLGVAPLPQSANEGDVDTKYYPFFIFRGSKTICTINAVRSTISPYVEQPAASLSSVEYGLAAPPGWSKPLDTNKNFLFFESNTLSSFLGYRNQRSPITGFRLAATTSYQADSEFPIPQEADAFLVILDSLQIDSYDSYSSTAQPSGGQRKNILSVIPSSNETGSLTHFPPYPTFIDLNNENPIFLRNIRARIVRNDYSPIDTKGLSSIVVLVQ